MFRSTCSSSPSPINSPEIVRRQLAGSINGSHRSGTAGRRRRPGAIDNSHLLYHVPANMSRIISLTNEGGRLRRDLLEGRDFKTLPKSLWTALQQWYGVGVALPRQVSLYLPLILSSKCKPVIYSNQDSQPNRSFF
jgi:hypothetical protein